MKDTRIEFIQALRGVAAFLVVLEHGSAFYLPTPTRDVFVNTGAFGVDLFFLISGFIMVLTTHHLAGGVDDAGRFMLKRLCRIVPLYLICSAVYVFLVYGTGYFSNIHNVYHFARAMLFVPAGTMAPQLWHGIIPLPTGWTLNYEMLFYAIFATSLLFKRARWAVASVIFAVLLLGVPWVTRGNIDFGSYGAYGYRNLYANIATNPMMWLFLLGMASAYLMLKAPTVGRDKLVLATAFFWALVIWQCFSGQLLYQGISFWSICLFGALSTSLLINRQSPIEPPKFLIALGNISYSLYLIHVPVMVAVEKAVDLAGLSAFKSGFSFMFLTASLSIVAAYICYAAIESRLSNAIHSSLVAASSRRAECPALRACSPDAP